MTRFGADREAGIYYALQSPPSEPMSTPTDRADDGNPKFGKLLIVLFIAVIFCVALTWIMGVYFPDFPNF